MSKFHGTNKYFVCQCTICYEAWPLKSKPKCLDKYICSRCSRDKKTPKKFSAENLMKPSPVPPELQGLSQTEEMLIARALPFMRIYIKPTPQKLVFVTSLPISKNLMADCCHGLTLSRLKIACAFLRAGKKIGAVKCQFGRDV